MSRSMPGPFEPRLFERFREIRIRPSSRVWVGIGFIAAALLVVLVTSPLVGFITENEWYNALGIGSVYRTRISYEAWLFCLTFVISFGFALANVSTALRLRSGSTLLAVGIRRRVLWTPVGAAGVASAALIALVVAAGARTRWTDLALFLHYTPYTSTGVKEPLYNLDVSFYLLTLPFLHDLVGWATGLVFTVGLLTAVLYAWDRQTLDLHFSRRAVGHLSFLLGLFGLALAAGAFLGRYDLLYSHNGVVWGAGYTDVNVRSGLAAVQAVLLLLLAGLLLANARLRRGRLVVVVAGAWLAVSLTVGVYPGLVQRVSVQPAELSQESPYIKHEINFTRRAYGLGDVNVRPYGGNAQVTAQDVGADQATIENLRLWDDRQIQETYQQLQSIRTYYSFKQIDLDRYFEPIYLKSTVTTQALPELKFVILTDATGLSPVTFQPTLQEALGQLTGEAPATVPPGTQPPAGAANPQVSRLLDDALKEYQAALDALKTDDLVSYQQHLQRMVADLRQADQLTHGSAPAAAPSASPRG